MSNKTLDRVRARGKGYVAISGSFAPAGAGITAGSTKGAGYSVAYTAAGTFTVTFEDSYKDMVSATATLQLATAADQLVQVGTYSAANKTLVIYVWDISSCALSNNVAADANNRINFHVVFKNVAAFK